MHAKRDEDQSEKTSSGTNVNTLLLGIANAILAAVVVPLALYLANTVIDLKTGVAEIRAGMLTRTEVDAKIEQIRAELTSIRTELTGINVRVVTIEQKKP